MQDSSPTSVFKVYNSSCTKAGGISPHSFQKSADIFSWAAAQQVQHDHNYCCEISTADSHTTAIDHGTINVSNIQWWVLHFTFHTHIMDCCMILCRQELSPTKRTHVIQKLSCILQQKPPGRHSPTFSSLDWLPNSLANWIRKTGTLGILHGTKEKDSPPASKMTYSCTKTTHSSKANSQKLELRSQSGIQVSIKTGVLLWMVINVGCPHQATSQTSEKASTILSTIEHRGI